MLFLRDSNSCHHNVAAVWDMVAIFIRFQCWILFNWEPWGLLGGIVAYKCVYMPVCEIWMGSHFLCPKHIHNSNVKHCIQSLFPGFRPLISIDLILVLPPNWHFHFGNLSSDCSKSTLVKTTHFGDKKVWKQKVFCGFDDSPAF